MDKAKKHHTLSRLAEWASSLGHGGVATYPDRPFLHWKVTFEKDHPDNENRSDRNNPETYLEGCQKLHQYLSNFAKNYYTNAEIIPFSNFKDAIDIILRFEGRKEERTEQWLNAIKVNSVYNSDPDEHKVVHYDAEDWEKQKQEFKKFNRSDEGINTDIYRFHQAAAHHRYYILKELLPKHGIAVY